MLLVIEQRDVEACEKVNEELVSWACAEMDSSCRVQVFPGSPHLEEVSVQARLRSPHRIRRRWASFSLLLMFSIRSHTSYLFSSSSLLLPGCADHAGPAADPRTDRHAAPRAATEHPHPQRADSKNRLRCTMILQQGKGGVSRHCSDVWRRKLFPDLDSVMDFFYSYSCCRTGCPFKILLLKLLLDYCRFSFVSVVKSVGLIQTIVQKKVKSMDN